MILLWIIAAVLIAIVLVCERGESRTYTPTSEIMSRNISDEEFLAAVPDATPENALRIRDIISDQLDVPRQCIHPNDRFVEDLRAD